MRGLMAMTVLGAAGAASAQMAPPPPMALPGEAAVRASVARSGLSPRRAPWPAGTPIRIRLAPEVADDAGVRAMLASTRGGVVGEPADYLLTTPADLPQTLMVEKLEPVWRDEPDAAGLIAASGASGGELGNLILGDYAVPFADAMRRTRWTRALLSLGDGAGAETTTCLTDAPHDPAATSCDAAGRFVPLDDRLVVARTAPLPTYFAVRNDAAAPRYLYLVDVTASHHVASIPLGDGRAVDPGSWVRSVGGTTLPGRGQVLVTIASARPLPAALLVDPDWVTGPGRCDASPVAQRLCGRPDTARAGWSAHATYFHQMQVHTPRIGGGRDAPANTAGWMAEFYSTVPYTKAEFAADDAKPAGEKEYLSARAGAGLYHRCGGTMIAPDLMLTAAHCVAKGGFAGDGAARVFRERRVRTGSQRLGVGGTTWAIDAMVVHAGYRPGQQPADIALVHLTADRAALGAAPPDDLVRLPDAGGLNAGAAVTAFGWGFTGQVAPGARALVDTGGRVQKNPERLQYGELQAMGWRTCRGRVGALLDAGMLCAETRRTGAIRIRPGLNVFSCVGDSGGPLVRETRAGDVLVGVASWSKGCGYGDNPSVYTNVAHFARWIADARRRMTPGRVVYLDDKGGARTVAPPPGVSGR